MCGSRGPCTKNPEVMLLDQPFEQLDAQTRYFMKKETACIWETERRTVLFVINNIEEAICLGNRFTRGRAN